MSENKSGELENKSEQTHPSQTLHPSPLDVEKFREQAHQMVEFMADYYKNVGSLPVLSQVEPGYLRQLLPDTAPQQAESFDSILADVQTKIVPGVTHWQSPSFFAYFPANSSGPGLLGEMLSACFNVIGFSWISSPACTELETIVVEWVRKFIDLPDQFSSQGRGGGVIQGTASEAVLVALLAARTMHIARNAHLNDPAISSKFVAYVSTETHSCVQKACMIAGIQHLRKIEVDDHTFAMSVPALTAQIAADQEAGLIPIFVTATIGTTSSTAIDPVDEIGTVCQAQNLWLHVDAAYAGSALVCPEHRWMATGLDRANSFCFNAHKWMLTNFDCSLLWVQDRTPLLDALSITPEYLRSKQYEAGLVYDYRDWQIPLGRRFRALKLWMVIRMMGVEGIQNYIRNHIRLAQLFEELVQQDDRFELAAPRTLSLVCFRLKSSEQANETLLNTINKSGTMYMVHTKLKGQFTLRFAVGSVLTEESHVRAAWAQIQTTADTVLANSS